MGQQKGITFFTDTMGRVTTIGGASNPREPQQQLLKRLAINSYRKDFIPSNSGKTPGS